MPAPDVLNLFVAKAGTCADLVNMVAVPVSTMDGHPFSPKIVRYDGEILPLLYILLPSTISCLLGTRLILLCSHICGALCGQKQTASAG